MEHSFISIPEPDRKAFAHDYCNMVYSVNGQACVIVSYPDQKGWVWLYDMDGGEFFRLHLPTFRDSVDRVCRSAEECDFAWGPILDSDHCDEAGDISSHLFGRSF